MFGEPHTTRIRAAIAMRYTFLPFWYTVFAEAQRTGLPVMRPLWAHYPTEAAVFAIEDQWLIGSDLMIKPITAAASNQRLLSWRPAVVRRRDARGDRSRARRVCRRSD